ncbi:hypothetical protein [Anaerosacchariphilus polymeriproducens]|uniref:Uncharacterized protein n=1 Tax=Anaerosacchariphilus polymeriproducens TaxID=1812858 RepID=A0A371AXH4_9FIRM|nr:hypothetical protein [Anaerosacchariphilus polymeriproducens]RDU24259.1 hypothetical protein DWV06_04600 [Anaerosacchariphilus polymeriproducens]
MAFSNTRDGQGNRNANYSKSEYQPRQNYDRQGQKPRMNQDNKELQKNDTRGRDFQKRNSKDSSRYRQNSNQGRDFKNSYRDDGKNEGFRSKSSGTVKETKVKEQQPDKFEIINRLEKEKKVMKKKIDSNNRKAKSQNARPQVKLKRTNNIDWTKEYENDSFDDDDSFYNY